jgi:Protein of unknown function (DUF2934)
MATRPGRKKAVRSSGLPQNLPDRRTLIAEVAYYKAERRGFAPGHELQDWCEAEREVDRAMAATIAPGNDSTLAS